MKALALLLLAACVQVASVPYVATTYPVADSVRVILTREAQAGLDSLVELTRHTRKEQAACVEDYATVPTATKRWLVGIIAVGPSNAYNSDSLTVWTRDGKDFCAAGFPNIHTHIIPNEVWGRPSDFDLMAAKDWPTVPFRVVVSVPAKGPAKVTVYGIR